MRKSRRWSKRALLAAPLAAVAVAVLLLSTGASFVPSLSRLSGDSEAQSSDWTEGASSDFQQTDSDYAHEILNTAGLRAYWSLDDLDNTLRDRLGLQSGTYTNPLPRGGGGVSGSSIRFQGTDQRYASVSARAGQSFPRWTLEFWVMPSLSQNGWMMWHVPTSGKGYAVQLASIHTKLPDAEKGVGVLPGVCITTRATGDVKCTTETQSQPGPVAADIAESVGNEEAGTPHASAGLWTHVVATFDGAQEYPTLYVDGEKVLASSTSSSQTTPMNSSGIYFGRTNVTGYEPAADAGLDEVALYRRVLTPEEIRNHYLAGVLELKRLDVPVVAPLLYADYLPAGFELTKVIEKAAPEVPLPGVVEDSVTNLVLPPTERSVMYVRQSQRSWIDVTTRKLDQPQAAVHLYQAWLQGQRLGTFYGTTTVRGKGAFVIDKGSGRGAEVWWRESDYVAVVVGAKGRDIAVADIIRVAQSVREGNVCDLAPDDIC